MAKQNRKTGTSRPPLWMFPPDGSTGRIAEARKEKFGTSGAAVMGRRMSAVGLKP